jgi:hypothetical protein
MLLQTATAKPNRTNEKISYMLHHFSGPFFLLLLKPFPLPVDAGKCVPEATSVAPGKAAVAAVEAGLDSGTGVGVAEAAAAVSAVEAAKAVSAVEAAEEPGKAGSAAAVEAD